MRNYNDFISSGASQLSIVFAAAREGQTSFFARLNAEIPQILKLRDAKGYSALMLACYHGHAELVEFFLSFKVDPNEVDGSGNSLLMGAAFKGHTEVIKLLLAAGADANYTNGRGQNASSFAQLFGRAEALALLHPQGKALWGEKLKAWLQFFKLKTKNERIKNV